MPYIVEASVSNNIRAEIHLGLKRGYEGFLEEKSAVINFLTADYRRQFEAGASSTPMTFNVTDEVLTYAYPDGNDAIVEVHEPGLIISSDKNPIYGKDLSEEEWIELVVSYATRLGEAFEQFRMYVVFMRAAKMQILRQA